MENVVKDGSRVRAKSAIVDWICYWSFQYAWVVVVGKLWGQMKSSLTSYTCTEGKGLGAIGEGSESLTE